jgi:hypothetical protein
MNHHTRRCEVCDRDMVLVLSVPKFGPMPALETFRCPVCGEVQTFEVSLETLHPCLTEAEVL